MKPRFAGIIKASLGTTEKNRTSKMRQK